MITQTSDGYIWIAARGLLRFDGVTLTPVPSQPSFPTDAGINWLLGSRDGSLWMATYQGLYRLKNGETLGFPIKRGGVESIIEDHAGAIWITRSRVGGVEGALCRIVAKGLTCYAKDKSDGNPAFYATSLAEDASGHIWFGCQMLCRWDGHSISHYMEGQMDRPSGDGVVGIAAGADNSVWVAMDGVGPELGVREYRNGGFVSYRVPGFDGAAVRAVALLLDHHQTLWVGTESQGLYHIHDGRADHFDAAQGLTGNGVHSIYEDREGNLWITTDKGVDLFRDAPIISYSTTEGLSGSDPSAVIARSDNSLLVGLRGGLAFIRKDSVSLMTMVDGNPIQNIYGLYEDHLNQIWLGINSTVMVQKSGIFLEVRGQNGNRLEHVGKVFSFTEDTYGNIWAIAFDDPTHLTHLLRIREHRVQEDIQMASLVPHAHFLGADPIGGIWIGTVDGKLAHYQNGTANIVSHGRSGTSQVSMFSLSVDSAGVVWAATSDGLYRWDHGTLHTLDAHNGLPCSAVTAALFDDSGSLWLSSNCGYTQILRPEIEKWIARPDAQVTVRTLTELDGADPGWNGERVLPNAAKSPDGRLWFVGLSSLQMLDPGHSYKNRLPPPVHIERLTADGKIYAPPRPITLQPLTRDIQIDYTALSFVLPQRMAFRYMLEGRDRQWENPGSRRQAFYSDLSPGTYRFRVIASNNDGVWNDIGDTLDFKVAAAWYQTYWFRLLCSVVCLLLLWALYRLRVRQIAGSMKARFDERLAERTRIARDLHDTLLQSFQGLLLRFQTAREQFASDPAEAEKTLESAIDQTAQAVTEGREAVQGLRASTVERNDLAQAITTLGQELAAEATSRTSIELHVDVAGRPRTLHPIVRDEIYQIASEALRNAFRHAKAQQIEVELRYEERQLRLRVRDDGKGISASVLSAEGRPGHFGLHGMRERAKLMGGKLTVWTSAESGTEIELMIPADHAYAATARRLRFGGKFSGKSHEQ